MLALGVAMCGALGLGAGSSPIQAQPAPAADSFPQEQVRRGRQLAALGDCAGCHTPSGGSAFAGGVAVRTPFGEIYSTNITPEPQTGIGEWPLDAFRRALRQGISRDGHRLYPAFPYDHFTHLTDDDIAALYAFLMTRDPVQAIAPQNRLMFPLGFRPLIGIWDALYLKEGPKPPASNAPSPR
ncbi:MAG TPA: cytochrome c [Ramlibacter sp.]|uniref:c-type cytochrome n=1 Tax=Ramlibacter sp. TaxID=1917967 RepID=UPI002CC05381|nr:cytochrome c [Ramlibacter sp.]HVZ45512.1 cytochrome c [Ramlibacter sp.]